MDLEKGLTSKINEITPNEFLNTRDFKTLVVREEIPEIHCNEYFNDIDERYSSLSPFHHDHHLSPLIFPSPPPPLHFPQTHRGTISFEKTNPGYLCLFHIRDFVKIYDEPQYHLIMKENIVNFKSMSDDIFYFKECMNELSLYLNEDKTFLQNIDKIVFNQMLSNSSTWNLCKNEIEIFAQDMKKKKIKCICNDNNNNFKDDLPYKNNDNNNFWRKNRQLFSSLILDFD